MITKVTYIKTRSGFFYFILLFFKATHLVYELLFIQTGLIKYEAYIIVGNAFSLVIVSLFLLRHLKDCSEFFICQKS